MQSLRERFLEREKERQKVILDERLPPNLALSKLFLHFFHFSSIHFSSTVRLHCSFSIANNKPGQTASTQRTDGMDSPSPSPLRSEVVHQERPLLTLLSPIPYHDAGAIDHLPRITLAIQHACFIPNHIPSRQPSNPTLSNGFHEKEYVTHGKKKKRANSHNPAHSPSSFPSPTCINGIECSPHNALTSFL